MVSKFYGQSTKETYSYDIELSRKHKNIYKAFEYFDDHSYCSSTKLGFLVEKYKDKYYIYYFQDDGPKNIIDVQKLLEWRRSGDSDEIGHKGGGNKRLIYGLESDRTIIISKINDTHVIKCETKPNKIYELSISDVDEGSFRTLVDSSKYINTPEEFNIEDLPQWYSNIYDKLKTESGIEPNYLIRMELDILPDEYNNNIYWTEYINQIRAKQYNIPILLKNTILNPNDEYHTYPNIDLIGINDKDKINDITIPLYYNNNNSHFYLKHNDKYIKILNRDNKHLKKSDISSNDVSLLLWGDINMFIVSKDYHTEQLNQFNTNIYDKEHNKIRAEDSYGVYLKINGKFTNYLPFEGKILGDSRNNRIDVETGQKNNGRFRMILIPNKDTCKDNKLFDTLIQTCEIKALSGFLNKSNYKFITKYAVEIFKGKSLIPEEKPQSKPNPQPLPQNVKGGVYIIYLGNTLYKYGMVHNYNDIDKRINQHYKNANKLVKEFTNKNLKRDNCFKIFECETNNPQGVEKIISNHLETIKAVCLHNIVTYKSKGVKSTTREYFTCQNFDFINQEFCNDITIKINQQ